MKRKQFTGELKAKVAVEALKGHKTISELSSEFGIHSTQVNLWKRELLTGASTLFKKGQQKQAEDHEAEKDRLEGIARAQLASLGAVPGQEATYCTVGRAQMDASTRVGWLLR